MPSALLETMSQQVASQCDGNRELARQEADAIRAQARSECSASRDGALKATHAETQKLAEKWTLKGEAEAAKAELMVQNLAVEEVLEEVRSRIREVVESDKFGGVLEALLAEVMEIAPEGILVLAPEGHVDKVKSWLQANGNGAVNVEASATMWDGVAVQDPKKTFRISNTLTGRFSRVQDKSRSVCMTTLFGSSEGGGA